MDGNGETTIFYLKIWNHLIETTIYKWLFPVPGVYVQYKMQMTFEKRTSSRKNILRCVVFSGLNLTNTLEKSKILVVPRRLENLYKKPIQMVNFPFPSITSV